MYVKYSCNNSQVATPKELKLFLPKFNNLLNVQNPSWLKLMQTIKIRYVQYLTNEYFYSTWLHLKKKFISYNVSIIQSPTSMW